jgi:NAD(P)-dependent dehydrogenase (short-subunit alcohol dehydrogenase family)
MSDAAQSILITGGTDGLGRAAALLLAEKGFRVFAAGRSGSKRAEMDRIAREKNLPLESIEMDVCSDGSVQNAVGKIFQKAGGIDVLINNAGVGYMSVVEELKLEDLQKQYDTNIFGVIRVTQAILPHMRQRRTGRILMMSSVAGFVTPPTYGAYSSSKFALEALSNALRLELYPFGIEVVLIEPGYIVTNFQQTAKELGRSYAEGAKLSPYAQIYTAAWNAANENREKSKTTPEDCARVMLQAIEASHPKARYPVTPLAKWAALGKRILPDTLLDSVLRRKFGVTRLE